VLIVCKDGMQADRQRRWAQPNTSILSCVKVKVHSTKLGSNILLMRLFL
jgi:hypothetical protein